MTTSIPETHQDLLRSIVGILSTLGKDGYPQVTALWFLLDDDGTIKLSLNTARQKVKNLQSNPNCTFFVIDPNNPYRTLEIRAKAALAPDPDYQFADKLSKKYGSDIDLRKNDKPGESRVVVSLQPTKINVWG